MWRLHQICIYLQKYQKQFSIPKSSIGSTGVKSDDFVAYVFDKEKERIIKKLSWRTGSDLRYEIGEGIKHGFKEGFIKRMDRPDWNDRIRLTDNKGIFIVKFSGWLQYTLEKYDKVVALLLGGGAVGILWVISSFVEYADSY